MHLIKMISYAAGWVAGLCKPTRDHAAIKRNLERHGWIVDPLPDGILGGLLGGALGGLFGKRANDFRGDYWQLNDDTQYCPSCGRMIHRRNYGSALFMCSCGYWLSYQGTQMHADCVAGQIARGDG